MGKNKNNARYWIIGLAIVCAAGLIAYGEFLRSTTRQIEPVQEQDIIWTGPGWYYGIWFNDEVEYNNWHHYHNGHYDGGYHRDREYDHSGDGRHSGGRGRH